MLEGSDGEKEAEEGAGQNAIREGAESQED